MGTGRGGARDINVPSYVIDPYGVIRWINTAARDIVGDVRGKQFSSIVPPEDRRRAREVFAQKISGTRSSPMPSSSSSARTESAWSST